MLIITQKNNIMFHITIKIKRQHTQSKRMQFTQIHQISSFLNTPNVVNSLQLNVFSNDTWARSVASEQIFSDPLFLEVIRNLVELNFKSGGEQGRMDGVNVETVLKVNQVADTGLLNVQQNQQVEQNYQKYDRTRSIIFTSSLSSYRQQINAKIDANFIRVFYFNTPIMKLIPYSKESTVKQLVRKSLDTYLLQNYDQILMNQPLQKFQMRLPINQNDFNADMDIQAIHPWRTISQNLFQTLILIYKLNKQDPFHCKPTRQYSLDDSIPQSPSSFHTQPCLSQMIKITLMDQTYFQLLIVQLQKQGNLQKLFKIIRETGLSNCKEFVVKDDPQSQFELMADHQVRCVEKNRLYLMNRKYMDEADDDLCPGPIRLKNIIPQYVTYLPPIGINEASRYQDFEVTKINKFGIAVDRVLGVDQSKIYNYEKQLRKNKRQITLVDKFLGFNNQTGTKKPFKLIKEIKQIKKFQGGVEVVYSTKTTTYIVKNEEVLQQIVRKLNFLLEWHKRNSSEQLNNFNKNHSFLKF